MSILLYHAGHTYLVKELLKQLDVDKHRTCICELIRNDAEEGLGTERTLLGTLLTSSGIERLLPHLQQAQTVG